MVDIINNLRNASRVREGLEFIRDTIRDRGRIMMMLGPYMFSLGTAAPQSVFRSAAYSWPGQERIGRRPLLQSTGPGIETIDIEGVIYPEYRGGLRQVQAMRELAGLGRPWLLVDGLGVVYGLFAILQVDEGATFYDRNGAPRRIDFRLQLEFAGDDDR
ncbi:MAG: phage tail protein [Pseudomonadales bacterium]|nr:phage tail protein [Pseudomonadales bacterium]